MKTVLPADRIFLVDEILRYVCKTVAVWSSLAARAPINPSIAWEEEHSIAVCEWLHLLYACKSVAYP